jgi:hypothetical protein
MKSTDHSDARDAVRRLCDVIVAEAERNPEFACRLLRAVAAAGVIDRAPPPPRMAEKRSPDVHAINVLRSHGEGALRGKLEQIKARADLKAVAAASGLVLAGEGAKGSASRAELIESIIAAAKHYDALRSVAQA